jgi:hypothetical protein
MAPFHTGWESIMSDQNLDLPLWGAEAIGRVAVLLNEDGTVDIRRTFYLLEKGLLPATKVGNAWTSTPRLVRSVLAGAHEQAAERRRLVEQARRAPSPAPKKRRRKSGKSAAA